MSKEHITAYLTLCTLLLVLGTAWITPSIPVANESMAARTGGSGHYLYVATPGIRNYLGYGGHGLLVFDIDNHHKFVKRIPTEGLNDDGTPSNVKGIDVSVQLNSVYITTLQSMQRIDLTTEEVLWEIPYEGGCDRLSISPDGMTMYMPSLEKDFWNVVDCQTGDVLAQIKVHSRAHNTIYGPSGTRAYMAGE